MPELSTLYGPMKVPENPDDLIRRFLAYYGEWAGIECRFVAQLLEPGSRVLDLGAFLGTFSLGLSRYADLSFVCAVEGNETVSALAAANLARNLGVKFNFVSAVVVGGPGARVKLQDNANLGATNFVAQTSSSAEGSAPQTVVILSDVIAENGPFNLIKMDVEGMELELLQSVDLELGDSTLWIECNDRPASVDVCRLLLQRGYDLTYFAFPSHNPDNFARQEVPIFPYAYEAGLVASRRKLPDMNMLEDLGCFSRSIATPQDLVEALSATPRWCPPGWENLSKAELVAVGSRSLLVRPVQGVAPSKEYFDPTDMGAVVSRLTAELRMTKAELRRTRQMLVGFEETKDPDLQTLDTTVQDTNEHERRFAVVEAELATTAVALAATEAELAGIRGSRSVRLVRSIAGLAAKVPGATRVARAITKLIARAPQ